MEKRTVVLVSRVITVIGWILGAFMTFGYRIFNPSLYSPPGSEIAHAFFTILFVALTIVLFAQAIIRRLEKTGRVG